MSMADDYCKASINLDKFNSRSTWSANPKISTRQQEMYIEQEIKARNKILKRYPYKYVTTIRSAEEGFTTVYGVKMVFEDGSFLECLPMVLCQLEDLESRGAIVELQEESA